MQIALNRKPRRHPPLLRKLIRIMKLTFILLTAVALQVSARGYTQKITLSVKDAPLEKVFESIRNQSGYRFFYNEEQLQRSRPVTIQVREISLEETLDLALKEQPFTYAIVNKVIVIKEKIKGLAIQTQLKSVLLVIDVKGRVLNEKGEPTEGVTVTIKGTDIATSTNANGEFSLSSIDPEAVLIFTSVNMETFELKVSGKTELAINLKTKVTALSDVTVEVNTGYQKIPKERATGSFEFVSNEQLNRRAGTDILSRLEGVTTGVIFDRRSLQSNQTNIEANNMIIRGLSTLTETVKSPLIVLNNFPYEGDINNINPNDVESISILKDAAAASIWGARAGNGVIVITTKQGQFNQSVKLSFNANYTIGEEPNLFAYPAMSPSEFIENEIYLFKNGYDNYIFNYMDPVYGIALTPVVEMLGDRDAGLISSQDSANLIGQLLKNNVRNDFEKYIYQKSLSQRYSVNLTGGANTVKYLVSMGYDKNLYSLKGNEYSRINVNSNLSIKPLAKLDLRFTAMYTNASGKANPFGDFGSNSYDFYPGVRLYPYAKLADENGNPLFTPKDYRSGYVDTAGGGKLLDWHYSILDEMKNIEMRNKSDNLVFGFSSNYELTNYLNLDGSYQFEYSNRESRNLWNNNSYYARDLVNQFTEIQGTTVINNIPKGGILDQTFSSLRSHSGRVQLNLNKTWKGDHQVVALTGAEIRQVIQSINGGRSYGYNENNLSTALVNYTVQYPLYGDRGNSQVPPLNVLDKSTDRYVAIFGNAAYTYQNKYIVSASIRKDAANLFGVNVNDKWKPFWTVGLGWNVHKEKFLRTNKINYLKLRASYGYQGNVNNSLAPYTIIRYQRANQNPANQPFATITIPANPGLSWETIKQANAGIDMGVFNNRLSGSIDVFHKASENVIYSAELDPTTGIRNVSKNSASIMSKGVEISLRSTNIRAGNFQWNTEFGFSYTSNKVKDFLVNTGNFKLGTVINSGGATGLTIKPIKGKSPYSVLSYRFAGLDPATGDPQGYLGKNVSTNYRSIFNQLFDTADYVYHGSRIPTYYGFLNNTFSYKEISVTAGISYKLGYYFRKSTINYYNLYTQGETNLDFAKRWQKPGDELSTTVPSRIFPVNDDQRDNFYANSTANVLKGDHVRLEYVRLDYSIPSKWAKKIGQSNLKVYFMVNNLGLIWKANDQKIDPEYDPGISRFPPPKMWTFGISTNM